MTAVPLIVALLAATPSLTPASTPHLEPRPGYLLPDLSPGGGSPGGTSVSPLLVVGEVALGTVGGYLGLVAGVALNFHNQGLSVPPDGNDLLLLWGLPTLAAALPAWLIGLIDLPQRGFISSLLHSLLGAVLGQGVSLGAGVLLAALLSSVGLHALFWASVAGPLLAAIGSTTLMELLKPGRPAPESTSSASLALVRLQGREPVVVPALRFDF